MKVKGKISEVFDSVQGEGIYLGEKQVFVRFYGCNLGCKFCDTKPESFKEYEPEELFKEIKLYHGKHHSISFTGGEPLFQKDFLKEIMKLTKKAGHRNYLETNGTLPEALHEVIEHVHIVAMDLKFPTSTGIDDFWEAHRKFLHIAAKKDVFLKVVVCDSTKEEDLMQGIRLIRETDRSAVLVLQPNTDENHGRLAEKLEKFKTICRKEKVGAFVIPQIHRLVGVR